MLEEDVISPVRSRTSNRASLEFLENRGCTDTTCDNTSASIGDNTDPKDPIQIAKNRHSDRIDSFLVWSPHLANCPEIDLFNGIQAFIERISDRNDSLRHMLVFELLDDIARFSPIRECRQLAEEFLEDLHTELAKSVTPQRPGFPAGGIHAR